MREILFRGKRIDNGEWLECATILHAKNGNEDFINMPKIGDPCNVGENEEGNIVSIPVCSFYAVDPKSLGQYTGLMDKNGKRIYEGDIVIFKTSVYTFKPCVVEYSNAETRFVARIGDVCYAMTDSFVYEVIGNIHDNPDLIGGKKDATV